MSAGEVHSNLRRRHEIPTADLPVHGALHVDWKTFEWSAPASGEGPSAGRGIRVPGSQNMTVTSQTRAAHESEIQNWNP